MKGFLELFVASTFAALAISSCQVLENNFFPASSRLETQRDSSAIGKDSLRTLPIHSPVSQVDTEIMCTAVGFPKNYNWRKDSTCGNSECEILLYKNGKLFKSIDAGKNMDISSDADMHHLIGYKLYTEYTSMTQTIIKEDGYEVVRFDGCELLKGLFPMDGDFYTLSTGQDGYGFSFRRNGEVILQKDCRVYVYGCLEDPSYPETGGLYEDSNNRVVFCYREMNNHFDYHVVRDGVDEVVELGEKSTVLDMKVIEDSIHYVEKESFDFIWKEAYIPFHAPHLIVGNIDGNAVVFDRRTGMMKALCGSDAVIYCDGEISAALHHPTQGKYSVYYNTGECRFYAEPSYYLTRRCAALVNGSMVIGINPVDNTKRPYLSIGSEKRELDGLENGYISGIRITVSQTN